MGTRIKPTNAKRVASGPAQGPLKTKTGGRGTPLRGKDIYIAAAPKKPVGIKLATPSNEKTTKKKESDMKEAMFYLMKAMGQLDLSVQENRDKVVNIIMKSDFSDETKEAMMMGLAKMIYNVSDNNGEKEGVLYIFRELSKSANAGAFNAGLAAVTQLKDSQPALYERYINTYAARVIEGKTDIGDKTNVGENFLKLVQSYAEKYPGRSGSVIVNLTDGWLKKPHKSGLWHAAMIMSDGEGKCSIKVGDKEMKDIPLKNAVTTLLEMGYRLRDDKANIAKWVTRQFDPNKIEKSGVDDKVMRNLGLKTSSTHDKFAKYLLYPPKEPIVKAMLDGLKDVEVSEQNMRSIVKLYVALKDTGLFRQDVIEQGVKTHDLVNNVLKFLTDKKDAGFRKRVHEFVVDRDEIGPGKKSLIVKYFIDADNIGKEEDVCGNATEGEIKKECGITDDILYKVRRDHTWNLALGGGFKAHVISRDTDENPFEKTVASGFGSLTLKSPKLTGDIRFKAGVEIFGGDVSGGAGLAGIAMDTGLLSLELSAFVASVVYKGVDNDLTNVLAFENEELAEDETFTATTARPEIEASLILYGVNLMVDLSIVDIKLGTGRALELAAVFGAEIGSFSGSLMDTVCKRGTDTTTGTGMKYDPVTKTYVLEGEPSDLCRDAAISGFASSYFGGVVLRGTGLF